MFLKDMNHTKGAQGRNQSFLRVEIKLMWVHIAGIHCNDINLLQHELLNEWWGWCYCCMHCNKYMNDRNGRPTYFLILRLCSHCCFDNHQTGTSEACFGQWWRTVQDSPWKRKTVFCKIWPEFKQSEYYISHRENINLSTPGAMRLTRCSTTTWQVCKKKKKDKYLPSDHDCEIWYVTNSCFLQSLFMKHSDLGILIAIMQLTTKLW